MAKILDRDEGSVLLKITMDEYHELEAINFFSKEDIEKMDHETSSYEFVFDTPVSAKELL